MKSASFTKYITVKEPPHELHRIIEPIAEDATFPSPKEFLSLAQNLPARELAGVWTIPVVPMLTNMMEHESRMRRSQHPVLVLHFTEERP